MRFFKIVLKVAIAVAANCILLNAQETPFPTTTPSPPTTTSTSTPTTSTSTPTTSTSTPTTSTSTLTTSTSMQTTTSTISTSTTTRPCPYTDGCSCTWSSGNYTIECSNLYAFPSFDTLYLNGYTVTLRITGNFSYIPANCVSWIMGATSITLVTTGINDGQFHQIFVDPNAFNNAPTSNIMFEMDKYFMPSFPTKAASKVQTLTINGGSFPYISGYAFYDFSGTDITITGSGVEYLENNAFFGLHPLNSFILTNNRVNDSTAFKLLKTKVLNLSNNKITFLPNYTFCECENAECANIIEQLDLSHNPISFIADYAYANLPNLTSLSLAYTFIRAVPMKAFNLIPNLASLHLENSLIDFIETNSFYNLHLITDFCIDNNPINAIEAGAFNGMASITWLNLNNLQLKEVDLLIGYGMSSLQQLKINYCPYLSQIYLSDYTKLHSTLSHIDVSFNNVTAISSDIQYWLNESELHAIYIDGNLNFWCNPTIEWMSKFYFCDPHQILGMPGLVIQCAQSGELLGNYLATFQYNC